MEESRPDVTIVVGTIEAHLEAPIEQLRGRGAVLHAPELLQRRCHIFICSQGTSPVLLEAQDSVGEIVAQTVGNEIATVLA